MKYTGNHTGYPDATAMVQLDTLRMLPWEENIPFFLLEFHDNGDYLPVCPRYVNTRMLPAVGGELMNHRACE